MFLFFYSLSIFIINGFPINEKSSKLSSKQRELMLDYAKTEDDTPGSVEDLGAWKVIIS